MKADYDNDTERREFVARILKSVATDESVVYLIDEATYMALPDKDIAKIAGAFAEYDNKKTKVVFSGSQSKALEFWGHIAFGGNAAFIRTGFLSYPEWLAYKGTDEVSERTYLGFLSGVSEFYSGFLNVTEYLQGCLDETVVSNKKSVEYVVEDPDENLTVEMLLDVLYASLIKLHSRVSPSRFADAGLFNNMIEHYFGKLTDDEKQIATGFLEERYKSFKDMDGYDCKVAMRFLSNCGLTTLTYVSDDFEVDPYITEKLLKSSNLLYRKPEIFGRFNLTVNYPMFYLDLVKGVLRDRMPADIPRDLLGSIVECHVRSLLPSIRAFEYRYNDMEIDYVSNSGKAIEISVSDKRTRDLSFGILPDGYEKILLTRNRVDNADGIRRIPYYRFIFDHSEGRWLVENIKKTNDGQHQKE